MKKLHKQPVCLNCNRPLSSNENFCPSCGQENTNHTLGISTLFHDFFSNYFSFDSKLSRSTLPFLVKPGFLTSRFNEGKRTSFIHPLKLYFIISFIFFFLLALFTDKVVKEEKISLIADGDNVGLIQDVPPPAAKELQAALDSTQAKINEKNLGYIKIPDTAAISDVKKRDNEFMSMMRNPLVTDDQVIENIKLDKKNELHRLFIHQGRKIFQKDVDVFLPFLIKNLSIMMFLLLPAFAFYLYVLFGRKERFYISHIIHALHLHSYSFLILALVVLISLFTHIDALPFLAFMLITLYAFFSVKRVYKQGWGKTLVKFTVLGFCYFMTLVVGLTMEVLISIVLF